MTDRPIPDPPYEYLVPILMVLVLVLVNLSGSYDSSLDSQPNSPAWAAMVVLLLGFWVVDVTISASRFGQDITVGPIILAIPTAVVAVHLAGLAGLGIGVAAATVLALLWVVGSVTSRTMDRITIGVSLSAIVAGATGSLILSRVVWDPGKRVVGVFLAIGLAAVIGRLITERFSHITFSEPFTITALLTVAAAVGASSAWDLDVVVFLLVGLILATVIVAGRGFGSMIRRGSVSLAPERVGVLGSLDGVVLAAAIYLPLLRLLL